MLLIEILISNIEILLMDGWMDGLSFLPQFSISLKNKTWEQVAKCIKKVQPPPAGCSLNLQGGAVEGRDSATLTDLCLCVCVPVVSKNQGFFFYFLVRSSGLHHQLVAWHANCSLLLFVAAVCIIS